MQWTLNSFLQEIESDPAEDMLRYAGERVVLALVLLYLAELRRINIVPDGLSGRFSHAFSHITIGKAWSEVQWLQKQVKKHSHRFAEVASFSRSFQKLITLRNQFYHPKEKSIEQIVDAAKGLLPQLQKLSTLGCWSLDDSDAQVCERDNFRASNRFNDLGFRLFRSVMHT